MCCFCTSEPIMWCISNGLIRYNTEKTMSKLIGQLKKTLELIQRCFEEDFPGSFSNVFILFSALSQYVYDLIFSTFSKTLNIRHKMKYEKKAEGVIEGRGSVNWSWIDQIDKSKQDSEKQYNVNPLFPRCCIWVANRPLTVRLYCGRCCISYFRLSFFIFWGSVLWGGCALTLWTAHSL